MFDIYPELNNKIQSDILHYKEFAILKIDNKIDNDEIDNTDNTDNTDNIVNNLINKEDNLLLENYQLFVNNFLNPVTPYNKLLINFSTGSGKSLVALTTGKQYLNSNSNSKVIILGFTKNIFKYELATKKIFNTLSKEEREIFKTTRSNLWKLNKNIKKKYIMHGYQSLFNNLFTYEDGPIHQLKKSVLIEYISNGKIKINKQVLDEFKNSFVICDEIHHLYNILEPNNWSVALMFILDYYPEIKVLFLSATPLKHSSKEIVYVINMLNDKKDRIKYTDLFKKNDLVENADEIIRSKTYGKICYVNIINPLEYPTKNIIGDELINNDTNDTNDNNLLKSSKISKYDPNTYFKFVKCKISNFINNTYNKILEFNSNNLDKTVLSIQNKYIMDVILPSKSDKNVALLSNDEIKKNYKVSSSKNIYLNDEGIVSGECLKYDNLNNISPKYHKMLEIIYNILNSSKNSMKINVMNINGKIMIFHPYVHNSGVLFIEEILKTNGFIKYNDPDNNNTICTLCGKIRKDHNEVTKKNHEFKPVQFININGNINRNVIELLLSEYNKPENDYGENIKILIASSILQEGYTIKSVQHLFVTHIPINISSLQQVIGRVVRKNSHSLIKENTVNIFLLTNSYNSTSVNFDNNNIITTKLTINSSDLTFEENYYKKKIKEYIKIQYINSIMYNNAVDYQINSEINTYDSNDKDISKITKKIDNYKITNVDIYQHVFLNQTLLILKYIIKRLFLEVSTIYNYSDLFEAVKNPPFKVNINTSIISEQQFNLAINELVYNLSTNISFNFKKDDDITDLLLNESIIFYNYKKEEVIIKQHNNFFFLIHFKDKYKNVTYDIISSSDFNTTSSDSVKIPVLSILNSNNITIKILISQIILDLKNELKKDMIIYDYLYNDQIQIVEYIIESKNKYNDIIQYYNKYGYIIFDKSNINPIGHYLNKNTKRIYNNGVWDNDYNISKLSFTFGKYYIFHEVINNYITQKLYIVDNNNKNIIKDKRLIYKGTICKSIQKEYLNDILTYFKLEDSVNLQSRNNKCTVLENHLITIKKTKCFLNLYEYANLK